MRSSISGILNRAGSEESAAASDTTNTSHLLVAGNFDENETESQAAESDGSQGTMMINEDASEANSGGFLQLEKQKHQEPPAQEAQPLEVDAHEVVRVFHAALASDGEMAVAVAAIKALAFIIENSKASTLMEIETELKEGAAALKACDATSISLSAACELFMRHVTLTQALESPDLSQVQKKLVERGEDFAETSQEARTKIAELGRQFIRDGGVVLTHGFSRVVIALLNHAIAEGKHFSVIITEGRPDNAGCRMAKVLQSKGVPCSIVLDSSAAYVMDRVDMVLVGSEGVVESGGIINKIGTYQICLCAKAVGKPVYVAAESYKFARMFPVNQRDVPKSPHKIDLGLPLPENVGVEYDTCRDYTPPECITLLVTDLGVLTPSAVSDELIQLYL
mmetsp:Transcript_17165/g.20663  ORF Transcript_17165/g.20663 Transcript_17165/m.20663 type:complete len:394 (-) Transcript_17165:65-1246(-)